MTPESRSGWRRLRGRLEMAAYRELRPLVRDGKVRLRTAIVGATMVAVFASAGVFLLDRSGDVERPRVAPKEVDTRRYDALEGLNDTPGGDLAAMNAGNERARLIDARGKALPECGENVVFEDARAADFCD